jgi:hypothetical protein
VGDHVERHRPALAGLVGQVDQHRDPGRVGLAVDLGDHRSVLVGGDVDGRPVDRQERDRVDERDRQGRLVGDRGERRDGREQGRGHGKTAATSSPGRRYRWITRALPE